MSRFRIIYIASLVILGVLIGFAVFQPMASGEEYSEVQRSQLLHVGDQWIIEFDIINREGKDMSYTIEIGTDGELHTEGVLIKNDGMFTYIHHFYPDHLTSSEVGFAVYLEGESTPLDEATYYLK